MVIDAMIGGCRSCGAESVVSVLDLGEQPDADDLCDSPAQALGAPRYPLSLGCCSRCGLVQLDPAAPRLTHAVHGHGSAYSPTVLAHEQQWAEELLTLALLPEHARILDTASGSGGLLRPFLQAGHTVRGWEPVEAFAAQATASGVPTVRLDGNTDRETGQYDLVLVNHMLSHAADLDIAVQTLAAAVAPGGMLAVEFHSALGILTGTQIDVICHAHLSYLSLTALQAALARHGLVVTTAKSLPLHGGVIRVRAVWAGTSAVPDESVAELLAAEQTAGLGTVAAWLEVAGRAAQARERLVARLAEHRAAGCTVAGYGAPSRGTTLLNYCGLGASDVPRTADRSPAKQGRYLPGAATRICTPEQLLRDPPDVLVVLVWPLRDEVLAQLPDLRSAGTRFLFPLPELEELT